MTIFLSIFLSLFTAYAILINYYRKSWNQLPDYNAGANEIPNTFISVIIPVRNEEKNLPQLIHSLKQQKYPASLFEVIIVDDHSTDNSWNFLQALNTEFTLKILRLADLIKDTGGSQAYKKSAIEKGIASASGQLIVTTDADCTFHPEWLMSVTSFHNTTQAKFIAAPVKLKNDYTFLSILQALDFLSLQGITGASVYKRFHTMCNGANLAYEKNAFVEVEGFKGVDKIPSGDDMLLMYKIYKQYPTGVFYLKSKHAVVTTEPMNTWREFFHQRIRWASKAVHYDDKNIFWILLMVYSVNLCFLILAIASFWKVEWLFFLILLLIAKTIIEFPFVNAVADFFDEKKIMKYFPLMQPFHILYTIIAGWLGRFGSYEWKGRRIIQ